VRARYGAGGTVAFLQSSLRRLWSAPVETFLPITAISAAGGVPFTNSSIPPVAWNVWTSPRCIVELLAREHSLQFTLPGARATALEQPSFW
jgi:hypothetical protein